MQMNIFLIRPVRNVTPEQQTKIDKYVSDQIKSDNFVYDPLKHTDQTDPTGFDICSENTAAIEKCDEVHIFWDKNSTGTLFDLGVAFALSKRLQIINPENVEKTSKKSFANMLLEWHRRQELCYGGNEN